MNLLLSLSLLCPAQVPDAPKGPANWKVEEVAKFPDVQYCSVVCCAPDGRVFLAEDPINQIGNKVSDRLLCVHPDGRITEFADKLGSVFGLAYLDGKLYVHHFPHFSVFDDGGDKGLNRVDLFKTQPTGPTNFNDHIPANIRLGLDGWFYMAVGDKGAYGVVGKDGSKGDLMGGGILRFRPDATKFEVYANGTRNHLDVAIDAEDEKFTYDNTDDGHGWNTRVTHMVERGFYGYPYDYKPQRPYTLWMMQDFGGGSPTGAIAYNEDALPPEYHGNLFMSEWGKGHLARFVVEREGGSFKIKSREVFLEKQKQGRAEFRPVGLAFSPDGLSLYIADWNDGGWRHGPVKAGRLIKATYTGKSHATPRPDWFVPAATGKPFKATLDDLMQGLRHPAQCVRLVAMRRVAEHGERAVPLLEKLLADAKAPPAARWSAIWTLDRIADGNAGRPAILAALADADPSVRRQAARQLGTRRASEAVQPLVKCLDDADRSVRFHAATALGRIGDPAAISPLLKELTDDDLFARYAAFTALRSIGLSQPKSWPAIAAGLSSPTAAIREYDLFAFREAFDVAAIDTLAAAASDPKTPAETRGRILTALGELSRQRPAWKGTHWGNQPAGSPPPLRTVDWAGTVPASKALALGLGDRDAIVRLGAAVGIAASNDPRQGAELARHVAAKESDESTRQAMLRLLVNFRGSDPAMEKAVNEHLKELLRSKNPETLALALDVSASLKAPTPEVCTVLLDLLKRPLPTPARKAILDGLSKVPTDENRTAIIGSLQDADAELATHAVKLLGSKALASVKGEDVSRALIDALKRDATRKEAAIALGNRKDSLAVPALVAISKDKEAGFDAVNALAQMPDARAAAIYLEHADSKNPQQRFACMKALEAVKNDALPLIEARLGQQPPLSAETVLGLQKIYANDPKVRSSALFKLAPKSIDVADFMKIALREKGNVDRGRAMFMDVKGAACIKCHTTGGEVKGGDVGPDLRSIAVKYNRTQIAESVLEPSKQILDGYEVTIIATDSGKTLQGLVRGESEEELTLVDAEGKRTTLQKKTIESRRKSKKSMMPDDLHVGMTTSEFADLIAYLESLNEKPPAKKQ